MARKIYPYSLDRKDAKIAGVCSALGAKWGIDPTFIRIAWVAVPLLTPVDFTTALIAYAIAGVYLVIHVEMAQIPPPVGFNLFVLQGMTNKQVAYALSISEQTVKNHMSSILRKLAVNDRTQAVVYAMRQGWIKMPED